MARSGRRAHHLSQWLGLAQLISVVLAVSETPTNSLPSTTTQTYIATSLQFFDCGPYNAIESSIENVEATQSLVFDRDIHSSANQISQATLTSVKFSNKTKTSSGPSSSPLSFEEYWCLQQGDSYANTPDSFPNNGSLVKNFDGLTGSKREQCLSLQKANYSSWVATATSYPNYEEIFARMDGAWTPVKTPPCCNTFCDLYVSRIQLVYWPTPAPTPGITTIVSDGYTFSSPSAYLIYHNVSAYGLEGPACNSQWPADLAITQAYNPGEIYSYISGSEPGSVAPVTYADLWSNCSSLTSEYYPSDPCLGTNSCPSSIMKSFDNSYQNQVSHCYPILSPPPGLQNQHKEWSTCNNSPIGGHLAGIFDPPHALVPGEGMVGPTPAQENGPAATSAAPALVPSPSQPARTSDPSAPAPPDANANSPASEDDAASNAKPAASDPKPDDPEQDDPSPPILESSGPDSGKPTPTNGESDPENPPKGSGVPFVIPVHAGSQNQPAISPEPGQRPQSPAADPGDSNAATEAQQPWQQYATQQPTLNAQDPVPVPVLKATEVQGHYIEPAISSNAILVDSQTVPLGGSTVQIAGSPVAFHSNGDLVVGFSTLSAFYTPPPAPLPPSLPQVITAAGQVASILPSKGGIVLGGTTLAPNAPAITVSGKPVSFGAGVLVIGSSTVQIPATEGGGVESNAGDAVPATLLPNGNVAIKGTTITANSPSVTIAGTPYALGSSGVLVIGSSTIVVPSSALPATVNLGGAQKHVPVTQLPAGQGVVVDGTTVGLGKTATISGTPVAVQSGGLVVGSSTVPYQDTGAVKSTSIGLGAFINSAFNGGTSPSTTTTSLTNQTTSSDLTRSLQSSTTFQDSISPTSTASTSHTSSSIATRERSTIFLKGIFGVVMAIPLIVMVI